MELSQNGLDLIKSFEGLRLKAYKATNKERYFTIGYGHYGADVKEGERITKTQAVNLLKEDVSRFVDGVNNMLKVPVNQNQFDAIVSLAYNIGLGALKTSTLLKLVNARALKQASSEFSLWVHSNGEVLQGLVIRRQKERELFNTPVNEVEPSPTKEYKIVSGDTLSEIAVKHETNVRGLMLLNPDIKDENKILVGQVIKVPNHDHAKPPSLIKYTIKSGDALERIAVNHNTTVDKLLTLNPKIKNPNKIYVGDIITVPNR